MKNKRWLPIGYAVLAATFYALNTPLSKYLLKDVYPTSMAAFLYLGAGLGIGIMYLFHRKNENQEERLTKKDLPFIIGMIILDILAPISLMLGLKIGNASNASLLGNFEIVATTLIAWLVFKENISPRLWTAIGLITLSSMILSFEGLESFSFSRGSLFVLLAAALWGLENNCTRNISDKSSYEIVTVKGLCCGISSLFIARIIGEPIPKMSSIFQTMLLGFIAYGLSIFMYVRAQRDLGAAKTSAFYAVAPFISVILSFLIHDEPITNKFTIAFVMMAMGTVFMILDY